ncbi:MAG: HAD family hydrolase [Ruminococcaceae bacterium]|nr:HAD family hydrolase [Oscillospiraceae bacterium]
MTTTMYDLDKTLFVTDLDGTLLRSDGTLSMRTETEIRRMTKCGLKLAFATARSLQTARKAAGNIVDTLPLILHNGTFIKLPGESDYAVKNLLSDVPYLAKTLAECGIHPFVYAIHGGVQKFSYVPSLLSPEAAAFQATRQGDPRDNPVTELAEIWSGEVFYASCIGKEADLRPAYAKLTERYNCLFGKDYYSGDWWLEILAPEASKANAVGQLKNLLGCERVVVFGDGHNDISMFRAADEGYAVAGASEELKAMATAVIGANDEDAVTAWLAVHLFTECT